MSEEQRSRPSIEDILSTEGWEEKSYLQLTGEQLTEIAGEFSGVPSVLYKSAMQVDKFLNEKFLNKFRVCRANVKRNFPFPYEQVVLAIAMALDNRKRKVLAICDTDLGSVITANLPIHYLYIFIGVEEGTLRFELIDQFNTDTQVVVDSEVIGTNLLKRDWGRGRRNIEKVLDQATEYLQEMSH